MDIFEKSRRKYEQTEYSFILLEIVKLLEIRTYVELGVRDGYTFNMISPFVKRAVGVDIKELPGVAILPNVETYIMSTDDFSKIWKDPIDLLFIDACHDKDRILEDYRLYCPFVRDDTGIIALHDTYPVYKELLRSDYCSNAWEAVKHLKSINKENKCEIFTLPGPFAGMTFIRKVTKSLLI